MQQKLQLEVLKPNWDAPSSVKAFFTYRYGGVSAGDFGSADGFNGLNLGTHVPDSPYNVRANRSIVRELLPADPAWLSQVHSTKVLRAEEVKGAPEADASFTALDDTVCVIMTADCVPVLFTDEKAQVVAAAHAGWKGLANGVLQETVKAMRGAMSDKNSQILAWIGPHIRQESFEVKEDLLSFYSQSVLADHLADAVLKKDQSYYLSLAKLVKAALNSVGVNAIWDCELDTFSDRQKFFSYRRDKQTGRHGAFIYKEL